MLFPLVTDGDLSYRLLLIPPNWGTPPVITHRLDTTVGEGRTTIEERRPGRAAFRLTQRITISPTGTAADDWRKGLAALGERLVAVPLWVDALAPVAWKAQRIYEAEKVVVYHPVTGFVAIGDGPALAALSDFTLDLLYSSAHRIAPLLLGRWKTRPPATVDGEEDADVTVEITEARPWEYRIGVNPSGSGWTAEPNWISPPRDVSDYGLELIELPGAVAAPATDRTDAAARWLQEAEFAFRTRLEIRTALTVFADKRGSWGTIDPLPAWFQPGADSPATPDDYVARFASDRLVLTYPAPEYATARLGFIQEVSTPGRDQALVGEAYLYRLAYDHDSGNPELLTNWDAPLTGAEGEYQPAQIAHPEILRSLKPQEERAELQLAYVAGTLAADWLLGRLYGPLRLTIWTCDPDDAAATQGAPLFSGLVEDIRPEGNTLTLTATLFGPWLRTRRAPGWVFGPRCNTGIFSTLCALAEADHDSAGTIVPASLSSDGLTLTVPSVTGWGGTAYPDNWFAYGTLRTGTGRATQIATILTSALDGTDLVLTLNRPLQSDLIAGGGQTVTLLPGCDGQKSTCTDKFDNYENFRGFPFIPDYIETRVAGAPQSPKK